MKTTTAPIQLQHVAKRYRHSVAVDDVSFTVPAGCVYGLVGPNGAGKTTLIRMLLGLVRPSAGTIRLFGSPPGSAGYPAALRRTGSIIEEPALYRNATARSNLRIHRTALGLRDDPRGDDELLTTVGLAEFGDQKPRRFSQGMRQRLGLAVALVGEPRLLILDEPTNALDPVGIAGMRALFGQLASRGTTVLVCSHLLAELELMCDRVAVMSDGHLLADGSLESLLADAATLHRDSHSTQPSLEDAFLTLTNKEIR